MKPPFMCTNYADLNKVQIKSYTYKKYVAARNLLCVFNSLPTKH